MVSVVPEPEEQAVPATAVTVDRAIAATRRRREDLCMADSSVLGFWSSSVRVRVRLSGVGEVCGQAERRRVDGARGRSGEKRGRSGESGRGRDRTGEEGGAGGGEEGREKGVRNGGVRSLPLALWLRCAPGQERGRTPEP
ncbi:hypothetical protein GCM10010269_61190 [Streptomyces humidus]|uniref:Uncharacterized protein n=1 Tax=Streptomyces humidus TaxID=52259 RepID=A0A918G2I2_9ACTN|nr:hypothetical protein GCM10010269_61190 [Streptomyces humidus]